MKTMTIKMNKPSPGVYGDGESDGYGCGSDGHGCGYGNGWEHDGLIGVSKVGDHHIYNIDGLPTAIFATFGNYAKAGILQLDMSFYQCFVARVGDSFAHGKTLKKALKDAKRKELLNLPRKERVEMFLTTYPNSEAKIPAKELFEWHHILTDSCLFGRQQFCKDHNINIKHDKFTLHEFVKLTIDSYGGEVIKIVEQELQKRT